MFSQYDFYEYVTTFIIKKKSIYYEKAMFKSMLKCFYDFADITHRSVTGFVTSLLLK